MIRGGPRKITAKFLHGSPIMTNAFRGPSLYALGLVAAVAVATAQRPPTSAGGSESGASIERGRYLTHEVAMCVQCHSPRDERGRIIEGREFQGAPIPIVSPYPAARFALAAPNIRELARSSGESIVRLLQTRVGRDGKPPDLPMPPFRMSAEDARSIVLYLQSLD
jgi:hypothetical protein